MTNIDAPCQPVFPIEPLRSAPDNYYFWDEYHPTRRVHQIIGEDMARLVTANRAESVPEPSSVIGLLAILGFVGVSRKR